MAFEKRVWNNAVFMAGGRRLSADSNSFNLPLAKADVDVTAFEDIASRHLKGPEKITIDFSAWGYGVQTFLYQELEKEPYPLAFTILLEANVNSTPVAGVGSLAIFADGTVHQVDVTDARGAANAVKGMLSPQNQFFYGYILFCNIGNAALTTGTTIGAQVTLPALTPGNILGVSYHVLNPPGVISATNPSTTTVDAVVKSAASGAFTSPITRFTFGTLSNPGGDVKYIDGDLSPISDTKYRAEITIGGPVGPPAPGATVAMAIGIMSKN